MTLRRLSTLVLGNCLVLAILLLVSEGLYRAFHPDQELYERSFPEPSRSGERDPWARPDNDLGWVATGTDLDTFSKPTAHWTLRVNRQGFRSELDYEQPPPRQGRRILMLGDSFVFGVYIEQPDTLPARLEAQLGDGAQVFNLAIPGWGIDQMYLAYEKFTRAIDPEVVVLVYINDDIPRVFESRRTADKPSFKLVDGELTAREHDRPGWMDWLAARSHIANHAYSRIIRPYESERLTKAIIRRIAAAAHDRHQRFVVVRYPDKSEEFESVKEWDSDLRDFFADEHITHLDPLAEMQSLSAAERDALYLDFDEHPAGPGNAFVARYIAAHALSHP
jgi:hypothetical protein